MAKPEPKVLLREARDYLKHHPEELLRIIRGAAGLRFGVPMDTLRYLAREFRGGAKGPRDVIIDAAPPGLRATFTVDAMGTEIRVALTVYIEEIHVSTKEIRLGLRIEGLSLQVLGDATSPVAGFIKSGALDLSKPGNLVSFIPKRPAMLVDAKDDRLVIDLMKVPQIAKNPVVQRVLSVASPVLTIGALKTKDDHLDVHLKADLSGLPAAIAAARAGV